MVGTVFGRSAPLAGAPALIPLSELLSIIAQLLIRGFQTTGQPVGTTPRRIPPPVQGTSSGHSRRAPCTAHLSPQGGSWRTRIGARGRLPVVQRTDQATHGNGQMPAQSTVSQRCGWTSPLRIALPSAEAGPLQAPTPFWSGLPFSCSCGGRPPSALSSDWGLPPRRS